VIELRQASKAYGEVDALQPTDLTIPAGQTTALIGPSGCGKSTILRLVLGLTNPDRGEVTVDDQQVGPDTVIGIRRKIGYVVQDGGLFPHLTAEQNITLMARHLDEPWQGRLQELAELADIPTDALHRYPLELSGGQRQRVGLMRALMLDPPVLLLDEPLAALDPMVRSRLQEDLKGIFAKLRKTVVLVTHDMAEAGYLASRIVLMRQGRIIQQGELGDFQKAPAEPFVTEFLSAQRSLVAL
jgi:osmoprotectant transport system ATP-binding protein